MHKVQTFIMISIIIFKNFKIIKNVAIGKAVLRVKLSDNAFNEDVCLQNIFFNYNRDNFHFV